jgi:HrpA-like RNA helicase
MFLGSVSVHELRCTVVLRCGYSHTDSEMLTAAADVDMDSSNAEVTSAPAHEAASGAEPTNPDTSRTATVIKAAAPAAAQVPTLPGVTAVLRALIEPPSLASIQEALRTLHECGMLTTPFDDSVLTEIGALSAELPVDFMLGRFIGYAVLLGVAREAVIVAAALGSAKSLFRAPNQLLQTDVDEFNR